ncbi:VWA domain-containing protein [Variovorax sp. LARHSF232]
MPPLQGTLLARPHRLLAALLCLPLLASGCSAAPATDSARWPAPAPEPVSWPAPAVQPPLPQSRPNFQAPSASHCARPVQTVELPGRMDAQFNERAGAGATGKRPVLRDEARIEESVPMPAAPPAGPASDAGAVAAAEAPAPRIAPQPAQRQRPQRSQAVVTAGMVDDNADFASYLQFRQRNAGLVYRERDVSERYLLQIRSTAGEVVPDAEVALRAASGAAMWARTDAGGRVWVHPRAFDPSASSIYEVAVRKDGRQARGYLRRGQKSALDLTLDASPTPARARLDLVFLVDATGSMGDEIGKLKATLHSIAREVAALPSRPDTCFGLVAYRDQGDAFLVRRHDLSNDLAGFQSVLNALQAAGGGDYPEALNEALHDAVHRISWRGNGATRLVVLLADAPPHLDYGGPQYDEDMLAALGKGIKVFSVGASGLDTQGEYVQRQIAQYTGGRFVFLTYRDGADPASGPGRETVHEVNNYSVDTLDRLIVRLVGEELAKLPRAG